MELILDFFGHKLSEVSDENYIYIQFYESSSTATL